MSTHLRPCPECGHVVSRHPHCPNMPDEPESQLERELQQATTELQDQREKYGAAYTQWRADLATATRDNASLAERLTAAELERDQLGADGDQLRAELARVTAERDALLLSSERAEEDRNAAHRARVAELEAEAKKFPWEEVAKGRRLGAAEQRNAELVVALRDACAKSDGKLTTTCVLAILDALARAESATPAKCKSCGTCDNYSHTRARCDHSPTEPCPADDVPCSNWTAVEVTPAKHPDTEAGEVIIAELTGKAIRRLNPVRLLQTGEKLCNRFGQNLWTIEAFHPKGARVSQWPTGKVADYTWEQLYGFFEYVDNPDAARKQGGTAHD